MHAIQSQNTTSNTRRGTAATANPLRKGLKLLVAGLCLGASLQAVAQTSGSYAAPGYELIAPEREVVLVEQSISTPPLVAGPKDEITCAAVNTEDTDMTVETWIRIQDKSNGAHVLDAPHTLYLHDLHPMGSFSKSTSDMTRTTSGKFLAYCEFIVKGDISSLRGSIVTVDPDTQRVLGSLQAR